MTKTALVRTSTAAWCCVLMLLAGCDEEDARLERVVDHSLTQQAEQSRDNAQLHSQVAEGTKNLVEADAKARQDLVALQQELRTDQEVVGQQRDRLEQERKDITAQRHRDQFIAVALGNFGLVLICIAPLVLAGYLIYAVTHKATDEGVADLLVQDITAERPVLLPTRAALGLPAPNAPDSTADVPVTRLEP